MKLFIIILLAAVMITAATKAAHAQQPDAQTDLWQKAIEKGDRAAQYKLGLSSLTNFEGGSKSKEGIAWLRRQVNQGDFAALYCQGMNFSHSKEFSAWLLKEADPGNDKGNIRAQYCLGMTYVASNDNRNAIKWVRKAADQGHAGAEEYLGVAYTEGNPSRGVERDPQEAFKWYRKAAQQGDVFAESRLGEAYYYGRGVGMDTKEAMKWWHKAANKGDDYAQGMLKINEKN